MFNHIIPMTFLDLLIDKIFRDWEIRLIKDKTYALKEKSKNEMS